MNEDLKKHLIEKSSLEQSDKLTFYEKYKHLEVDDLIFAIILKTVLNTNLEDITVKN